MDSQPIISIRNLHKKFGSNNILNGIDLDLYPHESFGIIGGSGTGKSVLIKCILGLIKPDEGEILVKGQNINDLSSSLKQKVFSRLGMLFQGGALFDSMTVVENIAFGLIQGMGMDKKEAHKIAYEKLKEVDLNPEIVANIFPAELSGGMQKRVALARTIAGNPEIIFFDEPTTGLDPIVSGKINDLIVKCVKNLGASTISITHDMKSLRTIANRAGLLFQGKFVWLGNMNEIDTVKNPYVEQFINGIPNGPFGSY